MGAAHNGFDGGLDGFCQFGKADAVSEAGGGATEPQEIRFLILENLPDMRQGVRLGITVNQGGLEAFPIQPGGKPGEADGRHDVREPGDIGPGRVGPVSQGMDQKEFVHHCDRSYSL